MFPARAWTLNAICAEHEVVVLASTAESRGAGVPPGTDHESPCRGDGKGRQCGPGGAAHAPPTGTAYCCVPRLRRVRLSPDSCEWVSVFDSRMTRWWRPAVELAAEPVSGVKVC